jgi:glycosyltransferase involved in cell wall biosynthesis
MIRWGINSERIVVVRNFTALASSAKTTPGRYGVYLGRLSEEKGLPDLLRGLKLAGDPPFRVAGTGPLAEELRSLVESLGLRRTRLLGHLDRERTRELLGAARYLVMPSRCDDNAPLAALEAMGEGRPLLVTDVGGLPELVEEGAGLTCRSGDPEGMATQLQRLEDDDDLCMAAGRRGLEFARRELSPQTHRRGLEAAYARAVADT